MDLKELLGEDLYNQVIEKAGDKKLAVVNDGNWFPKEKFNEVNAAKKKAEDDLKERDKQLEDLSKAAGATEELKKEIQRLQDENAEAKKNYETELKTTKLTSAIKAAIGGKVHDEDLVMSLIDSEKLIVDGDKVAGLDEQLKELQETKSFLFKQEDGGGSTFAFRGTPPPDGSPGGGGTSDKSVEFGKKIAEFANKNSATSEAQNKFFGGMKNE